MKQFYILSLLFIMSTQIQAQYQENFDIANKGVLAGPCGFFPSNDPLNCVEIDFTGVDWTLTGEFSGLDADGGGEFFKTLGGVMTTSGDIDEEICWESPVLNIAGALQNFSVDVTFDGFDDSDYIDVEYSVDGGSWTVAAPNTVGALGHTISGMSGGGLTGSEKIEEGGISGTTMQIRVCADFNSSAENFTADNVSAPLAAVGVLPVKLIDFAAEQRHQQTVLTWSTLTESNNDYFSIERSLNGLSFQEIGMVAGANNSSSKIDYQFIDDEINASTHYYRLRQVDFDGRFDYSEVIQVSSRTSQGDMDWTISPNPITADQQLTISIVNPVDETVSLSILDMNGRLVSNQMIDLHDTQNQISINTGNFKQGIYSLQLITSDGNFTKRMIVQNQ